MLVDVYEPIDAPPPTCPHCLCFMPRVIGCHAVHGDECDIEIKHGLCNEDGTPRRYLSKQEIVREAKKRGMESYVRHIEGSKHTSRWI